jgi:hypothetical protein
VRALVTDRGVVLLKGDIIVVTAGAVHVGERFKIVGVLNNMAGASPHRELALAATTEAIS